MCHSLLVHTNVKPVATAGDVIPDLLGVSTLSFRHSHGNKDDEEVESPELAAVNAVADYRSLG